MANRLRGDHPVFDRREFHIDIVFPNPEVQFPSREIQELAERCFYAYAQDCLFIRFEFRETETARSGRVDQLVDGLPEQER